MYVFINVISFPRGKIGAKDEQPIIALNQRKEYAVICKAYGLHQIRLFIPEL